MHDNVKIANEIYATHYIMDYLDHKIGQIREFQILESEGKPPVLTIVAEIESDLERIKNALLERWPNGLEIKFIKYDELIKVGWRQKFRHIINIDKVVLDNQLNSETEANESFI